MGHYASEMDGSPGPNHAPSILELNIRQMRAALVQIREEAATKENGGAWAGWNCRPLPRNAADLTAEEQTMARKPKSTYVEDEPLYNVDIWNNQGDVVKHFREVTADEVDEIRDQCEDEPWLDVVVEDAR